MLTNSQKTVIRTISLWEYATQEKNEKPITWEGKEFVVLSPNEIKESIFQKILDLGFSKIERVAPNKANCIVRVFQKLHYHYEDDLIYNIYGAICFTLKNGKWVTCPFGEITDSEIDFSKQIVTHWLCQDESIDFDLDFFDCYVKIS